MRKRLAAIAVAVATSAGALGLSSVAAAGPADDARAGAACVRAGIGTLIELGLLREAALRQIDYSTLADPENGPIFAELPEGSFLSLGEVVRLHFTNPELFAWCR
jgi:hypothetical protein